MKKSIILENFQHDLSLIVYTSLNECKAILEEKKYISLPDNKNNIEKKAITEMVKKYKLLYNGNVLNHTTFKLSALDLEMIKSVPPGGNWKDIPLNIVEKSERLKKITKTGGRTTLYGRIDYEKPSYTITTYFNRPGNGTYVHPTLERVLSVREAARLQTFPDDYFFYGNKTQLLKQVGNAVPSIFAYQLAKRIISNIGRVRSIDLFSGAGGLAYGFKKAGIVSVISNDIEESACITLKINNPEINVLCGDITQDSVKDKIYEIASREKPEIICGGPPCQGFSMAGLRLTDDPRNQLFKDFLAIVKRVQPKIVVFENVEGLLSYQNGKTYHAIRDMFQDIGYLIAARTVMMNEYAVPQKRKRVIIICVRKDLKIKPDALYPTPITPYPESQITVGETIKDLADITCSETAVYQIIPDNDILKLFDSDISYDEYVVRSMSARCTTRQSNDKSFYQMSLF